MRLALGHIYRDRQTLSLEAHGERGGIRERWQSSEVTKCLDIGGDAHIATNLTTTHEKLAAFAAMVCDQRTATTSAFGVHRVASVASASRRRNLGTRTHSAIVTTLVNSPKQASSRPLVSMAKSPCAQLRFVISVVIAWDGAAAYARGLGKHR